jgi:hypothetical protein
LVFPIRESQALGFTEDSLGIQDVADNPGDITPPRGVCACCQGRFGIIDDDLGNRPGDVIGIGGVIEV